MPSNPTTPRHSLQNGGSASSTPKASDSKTVGAHDLNSVQGRIRQWQQQNAAVIGPESDTSDLSLSTADNVLVEAQAEEPAQASGGKEKPKPSVSTPPRRGTRWVDPTQREWIREARSGSTPKKRVISDEHWKKTKTSKQPASGASAPQRDNEFSESPLSVPTDRALTREEREARRKRRRELRKSKQRDAKQEEDRTECDVTHNSPRERSGEKGSYFADEIHTQSNVDYELARRLGGTPSPTPSVKREDEDELLPEKDDGRHRRRSQYADALSRAPRSAEEPTNDIRGSVRSKKGNLFTQAKGMFTKSEPLTVPSQRLPSIEAWLNEQPDPFLDEADEPVDIPKPLKINSRKEKEVAHTSSGDPNTIWNSIRADEALDDWRSTGGEKRRRRRVSDDAEHDRRTQSDYKKRDVAPPSRGKQETTHDSLEMSSGALKRRVAKSSRTRKDSFPSKSDPKASVSTSSVLPRSPSPPAYDAYQSAREPPLKPQKQCPPTGINRLTTIASVETFQALPEVVNVPQSEIEERPSLERQLTTHEDLLSVLSLPRAGKSIRSAKSIRGGRTRLEDVSLTEVMEEFAHDESKYLRELRTLVDGVIPVLLKSVLSKSGSAATAGLFGSSSTARDDLNFTQPIIDMGIALERLKAFHTRAPTTNAPAMVSWAQSVLRVYTEYLRAWRLGFQDVIVNLAPADDRINNEAYQGMARDDEGYVINAEGKKVDVAYLLKRPLVRIKNLSKALNRLKTLAASSKATQVAEDYAQLVVMARHRSNEEQSRLEDEAAANIDATRARDLRTLAVLSGTDIAKDKKVKARDCFNLTLHHSTGQRVDSRVELLLRDSQNAAAEGGDLLLCELDDTGRWLFFPPLETAFVSARLGDTPEELVVMVRSPGSYRPDDHELLSLRADNGEAALEWRQMLGSNPLPPKLNRSLSFLNRERATPVVGTAGLDRTPARGSMPLVPADMDVPIGEPSVLGTDGDERSHTKSDRSPPQKSLPDPKASSRARPIAGQSPASSESSVPHRNPLPASPKLSLGGGLISSMVARSSEPVQKVDRSDRETSPGLQKTKAGRGQHRVTEIAIRSPPSSNHSATTTDSRLELKPRKLSRTDDASREWMASPEITTDVSAAPTKDNETPRKEKAEVQPPRPDYQRALSSTPSQDLPTISRVRPLGQRRQPPSPPKSTPLNESIRDQWATLSGSEKKEKSPHESSSRHRHRDGQQRKRGIPYTEDLPYPPPHSERPTNSSQPTIKIKDPAKPAPPPHRHSTSPHPKSETTPVLTPKTEVSLSANKLQKRRSSSPLKHEYAPSISSESSSDSDSDDSIDSSSSDTSEDPTSEIRDESTPLPAIKATHPRRQTRPLPPSAFPSRAPTTLAPSDSASQGPYRGVPSASLMPNTRPAKTIALVCCWSDKGVWESLHPDECSIVISPGLIEAYEMSAAHSGSRPIFHSDRPKSKLSSITHSTATSDSLDDRPLVAFELTPLVPLRRGTALDISIRSPPTEKSKIRTSNNVMFRSRNAEECEALYAMINHARINNPTYIALQNARPKFQPSVTFNTGASAQNSRSKSGSWFGFGSKGSKSSYRASSAPHLKGLESVGGVSESSVTSIGSAFSALRRFSGIDNGKGGIFNLNQSSVLKKQGIASGTASLYSSSSGTTGTGSGSASPAPSQMGLQTVQEETIMNTNGGAAVVNNIKIRLYVRESVSKWRDLGAARLTVLPASSNDTAESGGGDGTLTPTKANSNAPSPLGTPTGAKPSSPLPVGQPNTAAAGPRLASSQHTPHRVHGHAHEKRILVTSGKSKSKDMTTSENAPTTLLDVILGESCFERIARTGIAVSVWNEDEVIAKEGGVVGGRTTMYMLQMKSEAETGWVFGMVGRFRY